MGNEAVRRTELLEAARRALAASSPSVDCSAVDLSTPLAAFLFDSLVAASFIAQLEAALGLGELPFEDWLREHSERADFMTVGALVDWLATFRER